ncbi:MAG: helix-turn-helix domain-containing protein [Magnetococcales bacterium]|nr:helix-turn-helix domain-containing protein [Magnetococcales bacterium]MBF0263266.1 helix-turn-helix domain-containing protein [Magnetococcales bacterium]
MGRLLTVAEAAALLRFKPRTLDNWRTRGFGPKYVPVGGGIRYDEDDLTKWITQRKVDPTDRDGARKSKSRRGKTDVTVQETLHLPKLRRHGKENSRMGDLD